MPPDGLAYVNPLLTFTSGKAAHWVCRIDAPVTKEEVMEPMSIGEFALRSRLSPKALCLYDEMELLLPARVDPATGYRSYTADQLEPGRLVAALRQLGIPHTEIKAILDLEPERAADRVAEYWSGVETEHAARRDLSSYILERLYGTRTMMYEVTTREIPNRSLLCLKRNVDGEAAPGRSARSSEGS